MQCTVPYKMVWRMQLKSIKTQFTVASGEKQQKSILIMVSYFTFPRQRTCFSFQGNAQNLRFVYDQFAPKRHFFLAKNRSVGGFYGVLWSVSWFG